MYGTFRSRSVFHRHPETRRVDYGFKVLKCLVPDETEWTRIGWRMRDARKDAGLLQSQVAARLDMTSAYISKIENPRSYGSLKLSTLVKVMAACGYRVEIKFHAVGEKVWWFQAPGTPKPNWWHSMESVMRQQERELEAEREQAERGWN